MMDSEAAPKILRIFLTHIKIFPAELAKCKGVCFWKVSVNSKLCKVPNTEEAAQACCREADHLDLKSHIADIAQTFPLITINKENE